MKYDETEDFDDETVGIVDTADEAIEDDIEEGSSDEDVKVKKPKSSKSKAIVAKDKDDDDEDDGCEPIVEEHFFTEDADWKGFHFFKFEGRTVKVAFSKFFGKSAEEFEEFITSCVSKKAYHKMMRLFTHSNNVILNYDKKVAETFLYKYYCIKHSIDTASFIEGNTQQFINAIVNLFDIDTMNLIRKYVNTYYIPEKEQYEENRKSFVPAITFLNVHIKVLFIVSNMTHFIIPLCLEYLRQYKSTNTNRFLVETFTALFPIAQTINPKLIPIDENERPTDVYQKLYSFVELKVINTLKVDETMWSRQEFLGVNYKTTIEEIVGKLVTNIVPEYSFSGNTMHLNVSVVRKSIQDYTLRRKDPFSINCFVDVDANTSDDDNAVVTEAEQFDSYNAKHDELPIIIRHTFMDHTVNTIIIRKGVILNQSDIDFYMKNLSIHEFQKFVIMASFRSYFGGTENMYGINEENWVKLMLVAVELLKRSGPETAAIAKYVTAFKEKHYVSKKESRLSRSILLTNPLYNHIISTKYKSVKNIISKKNNFIENRITYLMSNEFVYNTPIAELNGKIIPRDEEEIMTGVLKFFDSQIM